MDADLTPASPDLDTVALDTVGAWSTSQRVRGFKLGGEQEEKESWPQATEPTAPSQRETDPRQHEIFMGVGGVAEPSHTAEMGASPRKQSLHSLVCPTIV